MSSRRSRRPPSLDLSVSSREPTPPPSTSDNETDDDTMTTSSSSFSQRPLSVALPNGPFFVKRPTLSEILSDTAPPPYTLSAFMAYLSHNHCLETLEFTMDASRYRKHFNALNPTANGPMTPESDSCQYVRMLWQKLLDAYIAPNGPREVNLPCGIRENLLSLPNHYTPPPPESLDMAVNKIYELMEESVLMQFINSCSQCQQYSSPWESHSSDDLFLRGSLDERTLVRRNKASASPPPQMDFISHAFTVPTTSHKPRAASPFSASLGWHRHSTHFPNSWSGLSANGSGDSMVTDDSLASSTIGIPMTPPSTPPTSDSAPQQGSPKYTKTAEKGWKKVTGKLSWKKKSPLVFGDGGSL